MVGVALAVVAVAGSTSFAQADTPPSVWDRARDPELGDDFAIHEQAMARLMSTERDSTDDGSFFSAAIAGNNEGILRGVIGMLTAAGAETSKKPLLRFDLAYAYEVYADKLRVLSAYQRAAALYKAALAEFPDYAGADEAWSGLAQSCAHIGDRDCEVKAWEELLRRRTEDALRLTPTLNLAEVQMHNGDLKTAIDGYREAFSIAARLPNGTEEAILAEFGLAIALDRAGEINEAEHEAKLAVDMEKNSPYPDLLHDSGHVYFVPAYEIHWYEALGWAAGARVATKPGLRYELWRSAAVAAEAYVKAGEPAKDRWLPIAKSRLATYIAERDKAEKQLRAATAAAAAPAPDPLLSRPSSSGPTPMVHGPPPPMLHLGN